MHAPSAWLDWTRTLNPVDLVLAAVILAGAAAGWIRGFIVATLQLLSLAGSVALALVAYRFPAAWLDARYPSLGPWVGPLSFFATYLAAQLLLGVLVRGVIRAAPPWLHRHGGNHLLGLLPGFAAGLINATVVALLLMTLPLFDELTILARGSVLATRLAAPAEWLETQLEPIFDPALRRTLQALTVVQPESRTVIQLPFTVADAPPLPDLEAQMLELINDERTRRGLTPLQADPELTAVARDHCRDMLARGYFSHLTPQHQDPFDRMRRAHVRFLAAGENIAMARTVPLAQQGLMNSPGHRANLLRPQFGRAGIGVLDAGVHGLMITQDFRN